ncbi:MAG: hypothetical protein ACTSRR_13800 [Candidatus Heimdallarchaeaceae archaeon]
MAKERNSSTNGKSHINDYALDKEKISIDDKTQTKEFLKVLSGEIGTIVEQLLGSIYNVDVAENYADAVIRVYQKLLDEGISKETVEKIVLEFSGNLNKMISFLKNGKGE